ncbi:MAG: MXAN_6640 family putative metalloprotease, partial [Gaiellaceae bacterium]
PPPATLLFRDLVLALDGLSSSEHQIAEAILARPSDGRADPFADGYTVGPRFRRRICGTNVCVHWVVRSPDAPSLVDRRPRNGLPDWIDRTRSVMATVWSAEIGRLGYRKPKSDASSGPHHGGNPNGKLDLFVADIGDVGVYGYCFTDDPARRARFDVSGYCVLDDDYARSQFPRGASGVNALKVTAAHEFHHASQFAYDLREDRWLMEGTATNMEAQVYPAIRDNYQYFRSSPLRPTNTDASGPWVPIDFFDPSARNQYGVWIFFRFLSEYFGSPTHPGTTLDPSIVRDVWVRADGRGTSNGGLYAIQAVQAALAARGATFRQVFAEFGAANAAPRRWYKDGSRYPRAGVVTLDPLVPGSYEPFAWPMLHLSNDYLSFVPGTGATTLEIALDLPDPVTNSAATVLVFQTDGTVQQAAFNLNSSGNGSVTGLPFAPGSVSKIVLVLTNGSTRFTRCRTDRTPPVYSCHGVPLDDADTGYSIMLTVS